MTPDELDAIEARAAAVHEARWLSEREDAAFLFMETTDVEDLIAALREAWAEVERLRNPDLRIVYGYELGAADLEAAEARADKAEAAIARVRVLCDAYEQQYDSYTGWVGPAGVRAALAGGETDA